MKNNLQSTKGQNINPRVLLVYKGKQILNTFKTIQYEYYTKYC